MIGCYYHHRVVVEAFNLFNKIINNGYQSNAFIVVSALQACAIACDLNEEQRIRELATKGGSRNMMINDYEVDLGLEHYGIVIDLLNSTEDLDKDMDIVK